MGFFIGKKFQDYNRLLAIYTLPEHQGQGVGTALITKGLEWFGSDKDIFVNLAKYNDDAHAFYAKFGFVDTGKDTSDTHNPLPTGKVIPEIEMVRRARN